MINLTPREIINMREQIDGLVSVAQEAMQEAERIQKEFHSIQATTDYSADGTQQTVTFRRPEPYPQAPQVSPDSFRRAYMSAPLREMEQHVQRHITQTLQRPEPNIINQCSMDELAAARDAMDAAEVPDSYSVPAPEQGAEWEIASEAVDVLDGIEIVTGALTYSTQHTRGQYVLNKYHPTDPTRIVYDQYSVDSPTDKERVEDRRSYATEEAAIRECKRRKHYLVDHPRHTVDKYGRIVAGIKDNDRFFFITHNGFVCSTTFSSDYVPDQQMLECLNVFCTEDHAKAWRGVHGDNTDLFRQEPEPEPEPEAAPSVWRGRFISEPADGVSYYYVDDDGDVLGGCWGSYDMDLLRLEVGNVFVDATAAEKHAEMQKLEQKTRIAMAKDWGATEKPDGYDEKAYYIRWHHGDNRAQVVSRYPECVHRIVFKTGEAAETFLHENRDKLTQEFIQGKTL